MPWPSLLDLRDGGGIFSVARRPAVAVSPVLATVAITIAEAGALAVAEAEAAVVALAVAVDLAHHCGRAFLMLVHANGDVAQHILVEPLLALDLVERGRRRLDVEQREMRLAVLAHPIRQGLDAPLLELGDLAAHLLDDALEL